MVEKIKENVEQVDLSAVFLIIPVLHSLLFRCIPEHYVNESRADSDDGVDEGHRRLSAVGESDSSRLDIYDIVLLKIEYRGDKHVFRLQVDRVGTLFSVLLADHHYVADLGVVGSAARLGNQLENVEVVLIYLQHRLPGLSQHGY